mmetsp:Transcript_25020/g.49849  ORF Transcript_25020/g.49849 Transcript_25020/m.49849 type:complete len:217 (-) Transcript_25020:54-704(-)
MMIHKLLQSIIRRPIVQFKFVSIRGNEKDMSKIRIHLLQIEQFFQILKDWMSFGSIDFNRFHDMDFSSFFFLRCFDRISAFFNGNARVIEGKCKDFESVRMNRMHVFETVIVNVAVITHSSGIDNNRHIAFKVLHGSFPSSGCLLDAQLIKFLVIIRYFSCLWWPISEFVTSLGAVLLHKIRTTTRFTISSFCPFGAFGEEIFSSLDSTRYRETKR